MLDALLVNDMQNWVKEVVDDVAHIQLAALSAKDIVEPVPHPYVLPPRTETEVLYCPAYALFAHVQDPSDLAKTALSESRVTAARRPALSAAGVPWMTSRLVPLGRDVDIFAYFGDTHFQSDRVPTFVSFKYTLCTGAVWVPIFHFAIA
jgi:hypothetical protein